MPIYEYECPSCGHEFEKIQRFSDAPVKRCPECGKSVRKKISVSAFMLKGGGWYADGYSGKGEKKKEAGRSNKGEGSADAGSGSGSGSETKASKKSKDKGSSAGTG